MPRRSSSRTAISAPRCRACSSSSRPSITASTAGPRTREDEHDTAPRRRRRRRPSGPASRADPASACPDVELVAVADARPEQAQAVAEQVRHPCRRRLPRAARPGRRRHDRRPHRAAPRSRRPLPRAGHRHAGREADGRVARRGRSSSSTLARATRPSCRSATSSGSTRPCSALEQWPIRPKYVSAERLSTYTFRSTDIGVVLDLMIHDIDLVLSLISAAGAVGRGGRRQPLRRP